MSPLLKAEGAVRPNVVAFLATLLLVAGIASVVDPPGREVDDVAITIEGVDDAAGPGGTDGSDGSVGTDDGTVDTTADGGGSGDITASPQPSAGQVGATTPDGPAASDGTTAPGGADSGASSGQGTTGAGSTSTTTQPTPRPSSATTYPEAPLYDDQAKMRGITDDSIALCGHAALVAAAAFNTSEADINVYWQMVNDNGGIYGRQVEVSWEDDKYLSSEAITAYENCVARDPFMILGGIGFDQIPGVRERAETDNELYVHHIAVAPTKTYNYSYSLQPTVEDVGHEFGLMLAEHYADRSIGILWRDSDNWRPGRDAGRAVLDERGIAVTADHGVIQNQGVYASELNDMALKGVDVVWLWENALNAAQIINQASEQGYKPTWVLFPFQTTLDILTDTEGLDILGGATWPAYVPGGYGDDWASFGLALEIDAFELAYAKYRPNGTPNDLLFQTWLGFKVFHQMLLDCGPDCNRNRFAGMMLSGYEATIKPMCPFSFQGPRSYGGHHGVSAYFEQAVYDRGGGLLAFRTTRYCTPTLG